jgi:hypothetical protein
VFTEARAVDENEQKDVSLGKGYAIPQADGIFIILMRVVELIG